MSAHDHPSDCVFCRNWEVFNKELGDEREEPPHLYAKPGPRPITLLLSAPQGGGGSPAGKHAGRPSDRLTVAQVSMAVSLFSLGLSLVAFLFALWVYLR